VHKSILKIFFFFILSFKASNSIHLFKSIKYLLLDEVDGFPLTVGKEGDPVEIAEKRTTAFESSKKILY